MIIKMQLGVNRADPDQTAQLIQMIIVCIDSNDAYISILKLRINTADTVFAAWRSKALDQCFLAAYRGAR